MNINEKISSFLKDDLVLDAIYVFLGTTLGGFFNLLYHLVSVRLLTTQDYGTFNALIAFIMFILMTIAPLGTALTRYFTEYITKKDFSTLLSVFIGIIRNILILAVINILFFIIFSSSISRFLNTQKVYIIICMGIIVLSLFSLPINSLFQALQKFKLSSFIGILSSVGKLIIGSIFMLFGWKVLGGILGFLVNVVFVFLISLFFISRILKKEIEYTGMGKSASFIPPPSRKPRGLAAGMKVGGFINLVPIYKYSLPVSIAMFSYTVLTNVDIILVKHFFSSLDSGYYSVAQMVGKITLFLPSALAIVILPKSTKAFVNGGSALRILYKSLIAAGICCFLFTMLTFLFPGFILKILTSRPNPASSSLVGLFSLAMSFYALLWININYLFGIHNLRFVYPLLSLALLEVVLICSYHSKLSSVLYVLLSFSIASFFISLFYCKKSIL